MKHVTEEQLMLFYYRDECDGRAIEEHLSECDACRSEFARLETVLSRIPPIHAPEPADDYESRIWQSIRGRLPEKKASPWASIFTPQPWGIAAAAAVIVMVAFLAGRYSTAPKPGPGQMATAPVKERILLVGVGDHLERSQMLLVELMNADEKNKFDLSSEQGQARDLLETNRLLRVSLGRSGAPEVSGVLDELERLLVEVANGPAEMSERELQQIQERIQSQGLLFRVRVIGSKVRRPGKQAANNLAQGRL